MESEKSVDIEVKKMLVNGFCNNRDILDLKTGINTLGSLLKNFNVLKKKEFFK